MESISCNQLILDKSFEVANKLDTDWKKRYIIENKSRWGVWRTSQNKFHPALLGEHFQGQITCGITRKIQKQKSFVIDIDNHAGESWQDLFQAYEGILNRFGEPSLIVRTHERGGLHLWYFTDRDVPASVKNKLAKRAMPGTKCHIDINPTRIRAPHNTARGGRFLDGNLAPIDTYNADGKPDVGYIQEIIDAAPIRKIEEIFGDIAKLIIKKGASLVKIRRNAKKLWTYDHWLKNYGDPLPGHTNEWIENVAYTCYIGGYTEAEASIYISNAIESEKIVKPDTTRRAIERRVNSHYTRYKQSKKKGVVYDFARKQDRQFDLLENEWVDKIMRIFEKIYSHESPNRHKTQRLNGIKAFLHRLNEWRNYIIGLDNDMRRILDIQYKYFYKRTKKKLIPLPRVLIQQWNRNYKNIIETLTEHGVIKLEKREYLRLYNHEKLETGQCRYYSLK